MKKQTKDTSEKQGRAINSDNYTEHYLTYDLGCSSALVSSGFDLVSLDRMNPKKIQFIFRRDTGIEKVADDYFADKLEVKARSFFDNVKMLKNKIYSSE